MRLAAFVTAVIACTTVASAAERERALDVDGTRREYTLIAPDKVVEPLPLLVVYHGGGQSASRARRYTRFDEMAGKEGFVAVYPQGLGNSWNDGRSTGDINQRAAASVDDVRFTQQIVDQLAAENLVDPSRVFLTGASNGGMMAMRAACELDRAIAGVAPVVANLPTDWECGAGAMPALFIHGTDDEYMPFAGGPIAATKQRKDLGTVRSVDDTIAVFKRMNGCTDAKEPKTLDKVGYDKTVAVITDYECTKAPLKQIVIQAGGHTWPGARDNIITDMLLGNTSDEVSATAEIWTFFKSLPSR